MKTFNILPWYVLLLIVGLCVLVMSSREGFTDVRFVEKQDFILETSPLKEKLKKLGINKVILIAFAPDVEMAKAKKVYPTSAIYVLSQNMTRDEKVDMVKKYICYDFDPQNGLPLKPYAFKKVQLLSADNQKFKQITFGQQEQPSAPPRPQPSVVQPPTQSPQPPQPPQQPTPPEGAQAQQNSQPSTI